jgi:hypothetical protein
MSLMPFCDKLVPQWEVDRMHDIIKWIALLVAIMLALVACSSGGSTPSQALPLATDRPTFVYFYTDN